MFYKNFTGTADVNRITRVLSTRLFWIFSFSILTAAAAQIAVPVKPVPFTLQTMVVLLSGAFLGAKDGAYSQFVYLALGIIGLPVFAQTPDGLAGIARLFGPTGGYLLAFPLAAFFVGYLVNKFPLYVFVVISMFFGELIIISIGTVYLAAVYTSNFSEALKAGAVIFSVWTVIKVFAAAACYFGIKKKS